MTDFIDSLRYKYSSSGLTYGLFFWRTALIQIILRASVNPKVDRISQVITTSTVLLLYVIFQGFYDGLLWTTILKNCVLIHFEDTINVAPVVFPLDKILVCYGAICLTRIWAEVYMYFSQNLEMFCFLGGIGGASVSIKNAALH